MTPAQLITIAAALRMIADAIDPPAETLEPAEPPDPAWMPPVGPTWSEADRALALRIAEQYGIPMVFTEDARLLWPDAWDGTVSAFTTNSLHRWSVNHNHRVPHDEAARDLESAGLL